MIVPRLVVKVHDFALVMAGMVVSCCMIPVILSTDGKIRLILILMETMREAGIGWEQNR